ncbi:MAG: cell division protein FtsL [Candidatus Dependentiae bacterium]|nr:cell division protein FtsL [Candidatus Dependentiae bacterium]
MKNKTLLLLAVCINLIIIFLLIHKQNKIIKLLYENQQLTEQKDILLQQKKMLTLQYHKGQQLSSIQTFAKNNLKMSPIKLKEAKTVCAPTNAHEISNAGSQGQAQGRGVEKDISVKPA